ncbi:hypothetical protein G5B40_05815 [Pikeienuella piscinae]|uniref:Uncharacterized protein n=1 Tax=Pikeienuella piscinae TaxID=2748098 RepID=A0A7L5BUP9_9RHOB|nr:hypothetical protein [Pikeienuella piscinae]QIE55011.1 hypothetical protein G5B40_05815 [Pikeienuella piscinae]
MNKKKIVFYELNEVPSRIFDHFTLAFPNSAFARLNRHALRYETYTEDAGHLSPWVTWPTLHRGVTNEDHEISDFGMDLSHVNKEMPPIWDFLARQGCRVGMFGSLHTYPLPDNVEQYSFYVPDTFAAGPECFPSRYEAFQEFNLRMVGMNGRNAHSGIALREAIEFVRKAPGLGLRAATIGKLASQIASERINSKRVVRRRTSQVQIAFDFFLKALIADKPDASFFFTNHVASSMHRYWPAIFPQDYDELQYDDAWIEAWRNEIPFTMRETASQLSHLMEFVERSPDHLLVVASSMGQEAVQEKKKIESQVIISSMQRLMASLDMQPSDWHRRPSMIPQFNVYVTEESRARFLQNVGALSINGKGINIKELGEGIIRLGFGLVNQLKVSATYKGEAVDYTAFGFSNISLQDAAGANAYHIPQGVLLVYDPHKPGRGGTSTDSVSTTEVFPTIARNFELNTPSYLRGGFSL